MASYLKKIIESEEFCSKHKENLKDFTRNRILSFPTLIYFLMNMNNGSYQDEIDRYFQAINNEEFPERTIYKGNLSKARAKLKPNAFMDLDGEMVNYYYDHFDHLTWYGFNLLAIDGTTARVPDLQEIVEHFGVWNSTKGKKPCPKARVSQMFDVLNKITVDAIISPKNVGERYLASMHFFHLDQKDLVLLDRGYPAFWLFKTILSENSQFCARISHNTWKIVKKFYNSGEKEKIVKLDPNGESSKKCFEMGLDKKPIKVRLIRVELDSGEIEILITSLTDMKKYPYYLFSELYHLRWPVEEDYKSLKYRLQIENWSGKTKRSVYQDFHAKVFSKNFTAVVAATTREDIIEKSMSLKYLHQINFVQALSRMKNTIVLLFNRTQDRVRLLVEKIREIFIQTTESVRPNRKFPRRHRVKLQRHFLEYKTTC